MPSTFTIFSFSESAYAALPADLLVGLADQLYGAGQLSVDDVR